MKVALLLTIDNLYIMIYKSFKITLYKYYLLTFLFFFNTSSKIFAISTGEEQENYYDKLSEDEYEIYDTVDLYKKQEVKKKQEKKNVIKIALAVIGTGVVVLIVAGIAYSLYSVGSKIITSSQQKTSEKAEQNSKHKITQPILKLDTMQQQLSNEEKGNSKASLETNENKSTKTDLLPLILQSQNLVGGNTQVHEVKSMNSSQAPSKKYTEPLDCRKFFNKQRIEAIKNIFQNGEVSSDSIEIKLKNYFVEVNSIARYLLNEFLKEEISLMAGIGSPIFWINTLQKHFLDNRNIVASLKEKYFIATLMSIVDILKNRYGNEEKQQILDFSDNIGYKFGVSYMLIPALVLNLDIYGCDKSTPSNELIPMVVKCFHLVNNILLLGDVTILDRELIEFNKQFNSEKVRKATGGAFELVYSKEPGKKKVIKSIKFSKMVNDKNIESFNTFVPLDIV